MRPEPPRPPGSPGAGSALDGEALVIDGHVHLRRCFRTADFLNRARFNLETAGREAIPGTRCRYILLLVEDAGERRFPELARMAEREEGPADGWWLELTDEETSLVARSGDGGELILVAGRQVVTEGRLEVLAPGTLDGLPDGRGLEETLARVRSAGAIPVLPWGLGKWWGTRGHRVREAVERASPGDLLLGDNAGRPRGAPEPDLFRAARARGLAVMGGSDPLPFPAEVRRVGGYGSAVTARGFDPHRPAAEVGARLSEPGLATTPFGARVDALRFLWAQTRLRAPAPRRIEGRAGSC